MNLAVYARVSTDDQELQQQLEECTDYALTTFDMKRGGIEYYEDTGSGADTERVAFQRLLSSAESGLIDAIVVHEISRLSRSMTDLSATVDRLKEAGVSLHVEVLNAR